MKKTYVGSWDSDFNLTFNMAASNYSFNLDMDGGDVLPVDSFDEHFNETNVEGTWMFELLSLWTKHKDIKLMTYLFFFFFSFCQCYFVLLK